MLDFDPEKTVSIEIKPVRHIKKMEIDHTNNRVRLVIVTSIDIEAYETMIAKRQGE